MAGALSSQLPWELANNRWSAILNPIIANPMVNGQLLTGLKLVTGDNVINHKLGEKLQGWIVVMNNAGVTFYDKQATNQMPALTLVLNASGAATISLYVF